MSLFAEMRAVALIMTAMVAAFFMVALAGMALVGIVGGLLAWRWPPMLAGIVCGAGSVVCCLSVVLLMRLSDGRAGRSEG